MTRVAEILDQPERKFECHLPADETEILNLMGETKVQLPSEYLDLLRYSNGGQGDLALPPLLFCPYEVDYVIELLREKPFDELHEQFFIFGGNGGLELIAFDLRKVPPYPIVMIDPVGGEDTAIEIAPDMASFIEAIGLEYQDGEGENKASSNIVIATPELS